MYIYIDKIDKCNFTMQKYEMIPSASSFHFTRDYTKFLLLELPDTDCHHYMAKPFHRINDDVMRC